MINETVPQKSLHTPLHFTMTHEINDYHCEIHTVIDDTLTQQSLHNFCDLNIQLKFA